MIAVFLPDHNFRGYYAPYLWVYYKFLSTSIEPLLFIVGPNYLNSRELPRWENTIDGQKRQNFIIPDDSTINQHAHIIVPPLDNIFSQKLSDSAKFNKYIGEENALLINVFDKYITSDINVYNIEAIITWCNCKSLEVYAKDKNIPVTYLELGPLRSPDYISTCYFDFMGVNGNTGFSKVYLDSASELNKYKNLISINKLESFFTQVKYFKHQASFEFGIALQVEDDSNTIAYSNSYTSLDVISKVSKLEQSFLIREHPGSKFSLKDNEFHIDASRNSREFISKCNKIVSINSSVIFEAILQNKKTIVFGDSSFALLSELHGSDELSCALFLYLFWYLIPYELAFNLDYLRFRFSDPSIYDVMVYHYKYYSKVDFNAEINFIDVLNNIDSCNTEVSLNIDEMEVVLFQDLINLSQENKINSRLYEGIESLHRIYLNKSDMHGYAISVVQERDRLINSMTVNADKMLEELKIKDEIIDSLNDTVSSLKDPQ